MLFMKKFVCIFLLFTLAFTSHKYYLSLTQVEYNKEQNRLEVIINVCMDDIEIAVNKEYDVDLRLTTKQELEDVDIYFKKYLLKNLSFLVNDKPVEYSFIGKEYEGDLVYFYIESSVIEYPSALQVNNTILFDYFEQQQNVIKFKNGSKRQSKILSKNNNKALLNF